MAFLTGARPLNIDVANTQSARDMHELMFRARLYQRDSDLSVVDKFGENQEIDNGETEDIWSLGTVKTFPTAAAATTVVSTSTEDNPSGTGAAGVRAFGYDNNLNVISKLVTLNGTTAVSLGDDFRDVFRAFIVGAGSNTTNVGNLTISHGATNLAQVPAGLGQTQMTQYTVPRGYTGFLNDVTVSVGAATGARRADFSILTREPNCGWRVRSKLGTNSDAGPKQLPTPAFSPIREMTQIKMQAEAFQNTTRVYGKWNMLLIRNDIMEQP